MISIVLSQTKILTNLGNVSTNILFFVSTFHYYDRNRRIIYSKLFKLNLILKIYLTEEYITNSHTTEW